MPRKSNKRKKQKLIQKKLKIMDPQKKIISTEKGDCQVETNTNTIFNLTFKFDIKYMLPK